MTAWTNTVPKSYDLSLEDLLDAQKREILRNAFHAPEELQPGKSRADLTKEAADKFSALAKSLAQRHNELEVAQFVNRLVFLFFAEDVGILKNNYFRKVVGELTSRPRDAKELLGDLFGVLSKGGRFGVDRLPQINGGLFSDAYALEMRDEEIALLKAAGSQDWAHIDPTIFGTLFERFLDPEKRSQIGAHYTDAAKILMIIKPVVIDPLEIEWSEARQKIEMLTSKARVKGPKSKEWTTAEIVRSQFLERLRGVSILDPACGSGNFLYLALQAVKDVEHKANQECEMFGLPPRMPIVGPEILHGIEINPLAAELAKTSIWIGDIQWSVQNGIYGRGEPILRHLNNVECKDALVAEGELESQWPEAEFIIGNPPFLGNKRLIEGLGEDYVKRLRKTYPDKDLGGVDLVSYWFYRVYQEITTRPNTRAGLGATNSMRDGANRAVLAKFSDNQMIFNAWADEEWVNDGADVRVSIICVAQISTFIQLEGRDVEAISSSLREAGVGLGDLTQARPLSENQILSYFGLCLAGPFAIDGDLARRMLSAPKNVNGRANSDVVRPIWRGYDVVDRPADRWVIDFAKMSKEEAQFYEMPYEYLAERVKPARAGNREITRVTHWWRHGRYRPEMRKALSGLSRFIVTPETAKHRFFVWMKPPAMPEHRLVAIAKDDDFTFGVLSSRFHVAWALAQGGRLEDRPVYNTTRTFDTFPFPLNTDTEVKRVVEAAARKLDFLRSAWLYPDDLVKYEDEVSSGYPKRTLAVSASAEKILKKRTLTRLYNEKPSWLIDAQESLDVAVAAAYGWSALTPVNQTLDKLLELNLSRAASSLSTGATPGHSAPPQ